MTFTRKSLEFLFPKASSLGQEQDYIVGLKGVYTIQTFLWVFLHTFVPAAVDSGDVSNTVAGPAYQILIKKTLSVLLWNDDLLYSAFILLSARSICIPFLKNPTGAQVAGSLFRRGFRLLFPVAVSLAVVYITFSQIGYGHIDTFKTQSNNTLIETLYEFPNALVYFNSVFDLFWQTNSYASQAGNFAFPTQTLWIISVIFQQSYTIYMTMVIIPYTRNSWRVKALLIFVVTAFWVQSWAWYSITGLLIADMVNNMNFKAKAQKGVNVWRSFWCPTWVLCSLSMAAGLIMQYIWVSWRPEYQNKELEVHTNLYYSGGLNTGYDLHQPQARDDNFLLLTGFLILLETYDVLQRLMRTPLLIYLGKRSLSWFLVQSIIVYSGGMKLWIHLHNTKNWSDMHADVACLGVCFLGTVSAGEGFYWLVDRPSQLLARGAYQWIKS